MLDGKTEEEKIAIIKQLYTDPNLHLKYSMDEIYSFLYTFSSEIKMDEVERYKDIDCVCVLPPMLFEGKFIKGVCYTQAPDLLYKLFPQISSLFHVIALSMCCNFPRQQSGDAVFSLYKNKERDEWFKRTFPHRNHQILIPLEDSDFTHEYVLCPQVGVEKKYDILMVYRISEEKNLPLVAQALKIYREKYAKDLKVLWVVGKDFEENLSTLNTDEKNILLEMSSHFDAEYKYVEMVGKIDYNSMAMPFSQAKICLLSSLNEGKNRSIREAMACDVPILLFRDFIKYVRGDQEIIPNFAENAGHAVEDFSAEALADGIEYMLENIEKYSPRKTYLEHMGRKNFFNIVLDSFPYYKENIPDYENGNAYNNFWIDLAVCDNYHLSLNDYLYSRNLKLQASRGLEGMQQLLSFYAKKFHAQLIAQNAKV